MDDSQIAITFLENHNIESLIGQDIDNYYHIDGLIGVGGMSYVFLVTHQLLNKKYAIKMLMPHLLSNDVSVQRFQNEGRAICELNHPNIINIQNFGMLNNRVPYIVMDYLNGKSLATIINENKNLSQSEAIKTFIQIANALSHAHKKGVIHRDLKPSNIIITKDDNTVKILDFGIAKLLDNNNGTLTQTGDVFGSPYYMSPEQCKGEKLEETSDIYSMGCLMFEVLTGQTPFIGNTMVETLHQHLYENTPSFKSINPKLNISPDLEAVVRRCLEKNPKSRYQSMTQLAKDLTEIESGQIGIWQKFINYINLLFSSNKNNQKFILVIFLIMLFLTSFLGYGFYEFNKIANSNYVKTQYDYIPLTIVSNKKIEPSEQFLILLHNFEKEIKTINQLSIDDADVLDDYLDKTKKYNLYLDSIKLLQGLITKQLLANTTCENFTNDWFYCDNLEAFLTLSHLSYINFPADFKTPINNLYYLKFLSNKLKDLGQLNLAKNSLRQLTEFSLNREINVNEKDHQFNNKLFYFGQGYEDLGRSYDNDKNYDEALSYYLKASEYFNKLRLENTANVDNYAIRQNFCLVSNFNLNTRISSIYNEESNLNVAIKYLNTAINSIETLRQSLNDNDDNTLNTLITYNESLAYYNLGRLYQNNNQKLSIDYLNKAISIINANKIIKPEYISTLNGLKAKILNSLTLNYVSQGNLANAYKYFQETSQIISKSN